MCKDLREGVARGRIREWNRMEAEGARESPDSYPPFEIRRHDVGTVWEVDEPEKGIER